MTNDPIFNSVDWILPIIPKETWNIMFGDNMSTLVESKEDKIKKLERQLAALKQKSND